MLNFCVYKLGIEFGKQLTNNVGCINLGKLPNSPHRGVALRSMGNVELQTLI
jgi:hypothetical protein